ncbi:hypothetical protein [Methanosarcina siciliae]|uniref:hypothetical protein n=1 Tax=Methanosarcina siciliae TaxID=38027 RepID=UPI001E40AFFE|nr:hypothetical protein [Methanosarcina siciliae]
MNRMKEEEYLKQVPKIQELIIAAVTKNPIKSPVKSVPKTVPVVKLFAVLNALSTTTKNTTNTIIPIPIAAEFLFSPMIYN